MEYKYFENEKLQVVKNTCSIFKQKDFQKIKDVDVREIFKDFDEIIYVNDFNTMLRNSRFFEEAEKIKKLKINFTQFNNVYLRETALAETDELIETDEREVLNYNLIHNLRMRRLPFTEKDAIYLANKVDMSYQEIKSYILDITLTWDFNHDFKEIASRLKRAIPKKQQQYTIFKPMFKCEHRGKRYAVMLDSLKFNNEVFNKDLYKLFVPFLSVFLCDLVAVCNNIEGVDGRYYWSFTDVYDNRVVELQHC